MENKSNMPQPSDPNLRGGECENNNNDDGNNRRKTKKKHVIKSSWK